MMTKYVLGSSTVLGFLLVHLSALACRLFEARTTLDDDVLF